jgi:hypothetical protein
MGKHPPHEADGQDEPKAKTRRTLKKAHPTTDFRLGPRNPSTAPVPARSASKAKPQSRAEFEEDGIEDKKCEDKPKRKKQRTEQEKTAVEPDPREPNTWRRDISVSDMKALVKPILKKAACPPYKSIRVLVKRSDFDSARELLQKHLRPFQSAWLDVQRYLDDYLNNKEQLITMPLAERDPWICQLKRDLCQSTPSSTKPQVISLSSCRGSGKTTLLKYVAGNTLHDWTAAGRIIVRDCNKAAIEEKWAEQLLWGNRDPALALCNLVCAHVEEVTGTTIEPEARKPSKAYELWISATKKRFNLDDTQSKKLRPIILLDTCEIFALEEFRWKRHSSTKEASSALEAFCFVVPAPYAIVVFGCYSAITTDRVVLANANVSSLRTLPPLTLKGYDEATGYWKTRVHRGVRVPLHELSGGLPRLLQLAHLRYEVSLAEEAWDAVSEGISIWREKGQELYQQSASTHTYSLLASATKFPVRGNEQVILPPDVALPKDTQKMTYRQATEQSMCALIEPEHGPVTVVVPPVLLAERNEFGMETPIKPSQLHPLLFEETLELERIRSLPNARCLHFEEPFLHSVYARYLLVWWRQQREFCNNSAWVPLEEVLVGALSKDDEIRLKGIEVSLKGGVADTPRSGDYGHAVQDSVTWASSKNRTAHHDAYLWCRVAGSKDACPMALRLRRGQPNSNREMYDQIFPTERSRSPLPLPLLVVHLDRAACVKGERCLKNIGDSGLNEDEHKALLSHIVFVDASAMSPTAWLKLVKQRGLDSFVS